MDALQAQREFQRTLYITAGLGIAVGGALSAWRGAVGGGFVLGCGAGIAAYLWIARMLPKLSIVAPEDLQIYTVRQAAGRLGLYAVAFALAFRLDRVHNLGIAGALAGYLFVRAALTVEAWRISRRASGKLGDTR